MRFSLVALAMVAGFLVSSVTRADEPKDTQAGSHVPRTFRAVDTTRLATGLFFLKDVVINKKTGKLPYFTDYATGKTYQVSDQCDETCLKAINECEDRQICKIKAEFLEGQDASVVVKKFEVISGETKKTDAGAIFTRVSPDDLKTLGIKDLSKFGEAWKDPSGLVWGDVAKDEKGNIRRMNHKDAESYCKSLGAELPTGYLEEKNGKNGFPNHDSDFVRLRKYMGAESLAGYGAPKGYGPQILPNLKEGGWEWSSSVHPANSDNAYDFDGRSGDIYYGHRDYSLNVSVRCVVGRR